MLPPDPSVLFIFFPLPSFYRPLTLTPLQCGYSQWTSAYRNIAWRDCVCVCVCEEERFWPMNPCCVLSSSTVSVLSKWSLGMQYTSSIPPYFSVCVSLFLYVFVSVSLSVNLFPILFLSRSISLFLPPPFFLSISRQRQQTSTVIWGGCIKNKHTHTYD